MILLLVAIVLPTGVSGLWLHFSSLEPSSGRLVLSDASVKGTWAKLSVGGALQAALNVSVTSVCVFRVCVTAPLLGRWG